MFNNLPVCLQPWVHLWLGWNNFNICCLGVGTDFGNITEYSTKDNIELDNIFNHDVFVKRRTELLNGELVETCMNCSNKNNGGGIIQTCSFIISHLLKIADEKQRERARINCMQFLFSIANKQSIVYHKPLYANIICGSACNLKCKFCYNCNMDYNPEPEAIINIIDKIHETLLHVSLTGGEPLITKAGRALLNRFGEGKYKFNIHMDTNCQYIDFDLLEPVNLVSVSISTDAATKKVYESIRIGGNFDTLISNIKKFVDFKKIKPSMQLSSNYTITSDNYMEIPEACKLYNGLGISIGFNLVNREKEDPQNIRERADLYDDFLIKIDEGVNVLKTSYEKASLTAIKNEILLRKNRTNFD